jgi:MurNAc alpha-1-phosphate uridylyltransferase
MAIADGYQGVILAAGKGTRMRPFSEHWPKPVLPVLGRPIVAYQLEMLAALGVQDVVVVIGHLGHEVVRTLGDGGALGVRIRYVEQEETLGIAHAVSKLEPHV